jgi:hypothetical protein
MKKLQNNQSGSALTILFIILIVALIGAAGWLVYKNQKKAPATTTTTTVQKTTSTPVPKTEADPTATWTVYSDAAGKFALRYPTTWVKATHPELCSPGILLLGPTTATVGVCASEGFGQVHITSTDGDSRSNYELGTGYTAVTKTDVTVDGVTGKKISGTAKGQAASDTPGMGALADGTIVVNYVFYTNGKTYVAGYTQPPANPDVLNDFNLLVTKSLTFTK